jgi:hypothetical protein
MHYYRIVNDLEAPGRWFLGEVDFSKDGEFWDYITAGEIPNPPAGLTIKISQHGLPLEITMADFELIVVNERAASLFRSSTDSSSNRRDRY